MGAAATARKRSRRATALRRRPAKAAPRQTPVSAARPPGARRGAPSGAGGAADGARSGGRRALPAGRGPQRGRRPRHLRLDLIMRLTRGRGWIGVLGALLVGIVALNVISLSLTAGSGRISLQIDELKTEISSLHAQIDERLSAEQGGGRGLPARPGGAGPEGDHLPGREAMATRGAPRAPARHGQLPDGAEPAFELSRAGNVLRAGAHHIDPRADDHGGADHDDRPDRHDVGLRRLRDGSASGSGSSSGSSGELNRRRGPLGGAWRCD